MGETPGGAKDFSDLLPWYLTGQLDHAEEQAVESWLQEDPQARLELITLRRLYRVVRSQPSRRPSSGVRDTVLAYASGTSRRRPKPVAHLLLFGLFRFAALTLVILICFWFLVQPGLVLEWSGTPKVAAYRVYRAGDDAAHFEFLVEVEAKGGADIYRYVDTLLLPGESYRYRVEGVGSGGVLASSDTLVASAAQALPAQLIVAASAGLAALGISQLVGRWRYGVE